jgi:hypothetical protein
VKVVLYNDKNITAKIYLKKKFANIFRDIFVLKFLFRDDQEIFKEALATILTKKIICFGNW